MNLKLAFILCLTAAFILDAHAGSATWKANPTSSDWNTASNWTPETVPGAGDTATFDSSSITTISIPTAVEVNKLVFNQAASAYTIAPSDLYNTTFTIRGGVTNNSGLVQKFGKDVAPYSFFNFYAPLDDLVAVTGGFYCYADIGAGNFTIPGGLLPSFFFFAPASAGTGTYNIFGQLSFEYTSTADVATLIVNSGGNGVIRGSLSFLTAATAANASIDVAGASTTELNTRGILSFSGGASAGNAKITANGGSNGGEGAYVSLSERSTGDMAEITLSGNAQLNLSYHFTSPELVIGSLAGTGNVFLGQFDLTIGSNSLSTTFSGVIQDGGPGGGTGGSLTKVGSGALTLTGANVYTGGTQITKGILLVENKSGSGTGNGPVWVLAGTLGGRGTIAQFVTVGGKRGQGGVLAPGAGSAKPTRLTIQSVLTFEDDGSYTCKVSTKKVDADQVVAKGVGINPGARFILAATGSKLLPVGTVFTVINNTAATPIDGTFNNLADGATVMVGSNTFQANYEGGDGNDLTLTVVP